MKILELFNNSVKLLDSVGIKTSKLDVRILLAHLLNIDSKELILHFNKNVKQEFIDNFNKLLSRRINREPIANILNKKLFWDYSFFVDQNVLTPRNDSETLIEAVLSHYKNKNQELKILDLGTGSGCLILTLLKIYKNANGIGIDINEKSLQIAKKNAELLEIDNRISFIKNNWNDNIDDKFDIIISNPPYIPTDEIDILEPEVNKFNPLLALDGGTDGLDCYKYLSKSLQKNIKNSTKIFLEIGKGQENDINDIFSANNYKLLNMYKDLSGVNRVLCFVPRETVK